MDANNKGEQVNEDNEFKASVLTLIKEALYAAMVLLVLSGIELLVEYLKLKEEIKAFIVTVHEFSVTAVYLMLVLKSLLRIALKNWRQLCKLIR